MPRGDKSKSAQTQKHKAEHIQEDYEDRGVPEDEAERRAGTTVNKMDDGGKKPGGAGRGKTTRKAPAKKGGKKGVAASAARPQAACSKSAKPAAQTRQKKASKKSGGATRKKPTQEEARLLIPVFSYPSSNRLFGRPAIPTFARHLNNANLPAPPRDLTELICLAHSSPLC